MNIYNTSISIIFFFNIMRQKGIDLNQDFYVVVGKQWRTENAYTGELYDIFI